MSDHRAGKWPLCESSSEYEGVREQARVGKGGLHSHTPELANRLADHIAKCLTDEEAVALEDISCDCIQRWRKGNPEFCVTIKRQRRDLREGLLDRAANGWQGPQSF
jgi:hypothetical protein